MAAFQINARLESQYNSGAASTLLILNGSRVCDVAAEVLPWEIFALSRHADKDLAASLATLPNSPCGKESTAPQRCFGPASPPLLFSPACYEIVRIKYSCHTGRIGAHT